MYRQSKVLVIGSGPIIIGQAAEFDYSGTQACRALREESVTTVLVDSNPPTIMTDEEIADIVYIEPLTVEVLARIIERERPDGLLPTLGGQTGSILAVETSATALTLPLSGNAGWGTSGGRTGRMAVPSRQRRMTSSPIGEILPTALSAAETASMILTVATSARMAGFAP